MHGNAHGPSSARRKARSIMCASAGWGRSDAGQRGADQPPGRGWWRNIIDLYGAADILVAEVQLQRLYPGGPARARFIAPPWTR